MKKLINKKILVSIIIPYHKKKLFFSSTIKSIKNQISKNYEVIVIYDDKNLDELPFVKNQLKKIKNKKLIINKKVIGPGLSRNKGIKLAQGKYISFCDSDDTWKKNKLSYQIDFMIKNNLKFSHSNLKEILPIGYITDYKFLKRKNEAIELRKKILETDAKYIIGLFDQGSQLDNKWEVSHKISSITYKFLLKKIIEDKNFALIIKPKKPKLLREKLGTEYELLIRAKNTGRCIIFDNSF